MAQPAKEMTAEQAINILDNATAVLNASRQDHVNIIKALEVLKKLATKEE